MLPILVLLAAPPLPVLPLRHAHAHNDYAHPRPLFNALSRGFTSVEADIFLTNKQLLVGHYRWELRPQRTLESLYLAPLRQRLRANGGKIYPDGSPFYLLIDLKTEAEATYAEVHRLLSRYAELFTTVRDGRLFPGPITVIISGNIPRDSIQLQKVRYAAIDGRPPDLDSVAPAHLIPMISTSWTSQFRWRGEGPFPEPERRKLHDFVTRAHQRGRLVRFWATPERPALWKALREAGVDLLNTDRLTDLQQFLLHEHSNRMP